MHTRAPKLRFLLALALGATLPACSADKPRAPTAHNKPRTQEDAGGTDAHVPTPEADAGSATELRAGDTFLCSFHPGDRMSGPDDVRAHVLRSAANVHGFGQLFQRMDGSLILRALDVTGAAQPEGRVTAASDTIEAPALVAGESGFLLAYRERVGSRFALRVRDLDDATTPLTVVTEDLAFDASAEGSRGETWALAASDDGFAVVYRRRDDALAHVQLLDENGQPSGDEQKFAWHAGVSTPEQLALASFETGDYLLAYAHVDAGGARVVTGQKLGTDGTPSEARTLSHSPPSEAPFSLAARSDSAGLLYPSRDGGLREALKMRRIDDSGATEGPELNVANAPRVVRDGSIASFGRGYVLVYRELPSFGRSEAEVRIAFVDPFGGVVYDAAIATVGSLPAATSVAAQGTHVLVTWNTPSPSGSATVETLRMDCPGALVLCGGRVD